MAKSSVAVALLTGFLVGFLYHQIVDAIFAPSSSTHHNEDIIGISKSAPHLSPNERLVRLESQVAQLLALQTASKPGLAHAQLVKENRPTGVVITTSEDAEEIAPSTLNNNEIRQDAQGAATGACTGKKYHVILTAQDSVYQAWQTRVMYYHYKKQKALDPCGEIGGFTRMLNSGRSDALMDEMPTIVVDQLDQGNGCKHTKENTCDMGFPVMNRPHGVQQLLQKLPASITEEYVLITETDHVFLKPIPNLATPSRPVCYPFGYMNAKAPMLRPIVEKFGFDPNVVDPCGPSPVLIHLPLLRKLTPEWLKLSFALKRDAEADKIFGWVLEMWGYTLAAAKLGVRHHVWSEFQQEPASLWHTDLDGNPHIYHYTFGLEYTTDGIPVKKIGDWSLDKRHFMNSYPSADLAPPPKCAGKAAHTLRSLWVEAASNHPNWPEGGRGTTGWGPAGLPGSSFTNLALESQIVSVGPWSWAGENGLYFFKGGRAHTPWGSAQWAFAKGKDSIRIDLGVECGTWDLTFDSSRKSFVAKSASGQSTMGRLTPREATKGAATLPSSSQSKSPLAQRLLGSGPWAWGGVAPMAFLNDSLLVTPWGEGVWTMNNDGRVKVTFVGEDHLLKFDECWSFVSHRVRDHDLAVGSALIGDPVSNCPALSGKHYETAGFRRPQSED